MPVMCDAPAPGAGVGVVGENRLIPDWETLRALPYSKGHARVMTDVYTLAGEPSRLCPRYFLKRMTAEAAKNGFHMKVGIENEFSLLKKTCNGKGIEPVDTTLFCSTLSMDLNHNVMTDILGALLQQGLELEQYHPESAPGQQEITARYSDAMNAADEQILLRETVKAVASKHQLFGSFVPKIFPTYPGNGTHMHLSLHRSDGRNIVGSETATNQLSQIASHFIAGVLEHLPALMAITVPSTNSYRRLKPNTWSGAFHCWGYNNRECAIRVPLNPNPPSPTHFELKTSDSTGNPYLALGATIAAGLDGVKRKLPLSSSVDFDPGTLSEEERLALDIEELPQSLRESLDALHGDKVLLDALQPELSRVVLAVREAEWEAMKDMSLEEEVELLLQRY